MTGLNFRRTEGPQRTLKEIHVDGTGFSLGFAAMRETKVAMQAMAKRLLLERCLTCGDGDLSRWLS